MRAEYQSILFQLASSPKTGFDLRQQAMQFLSELNGFDWSGIYALKGDMLHLDAYVGAATDHTEIPVGRGVCGSAVSENRNKVIADVREEENYLACSLETRSEIVVLIKKGETILGQIDIDGHVVDRFRREEEEFLSEMAEVLASKWQ